MKYRKKPVIIEAIIFNGKNFAECEKFIGKHNYDNTLNFPNIITLEGTMRITVGDYIIKGIAGEFYPCKPEIFSKTYEVVKGGIATSEELESSDLSISILNWNVLPNDLHIDSKFYEKIIIDGVDYKDLIKQLKELKESK